VTICDIVDQQMRFSSSTSANVLVIQMSLVLHLIRSFTGKVIVAERQIKSQVVTLKDYLDQLILVNPFFKQEMN